MRKPQITPQKSTPRYNNIKILSVKKKKKKFKKLPEEKNTLPIKE